MDIEDDDWLPPPPKIASNAQKTTDEDSTLKKLRLCISLLIGIFKCQIRILAACYCFVLLTSLEFVLRLSSAGNDCSNSVILHTSIYFLKMLALFLFLKKELVNLALITNSNGKMELLALFFSLFTSPFCVLMWRGPRTKENILEIMKLLKFIISGFIWS